MLNRRELFQVATAGTAAALFPLGLQAQGKAGAFTLGKLPYAYDALEPSIDAETMTIHHTKHHQAYVDNLNKAIGGAADFQGKTIEELLTNLSKLPMAIRGAVRNNGGGHWNHTFFWSVMAKPGTGGEPTGDLLKAIDESFGSLDGFKKAFLAAALGQFGSGWAWLIPGKAKPLAITATPNQDNPQMAGGPTPILGVDVWEHAYYVKYRNLRAKYVEAWFNVVNWKAVAENYAASKKS
jgi:superoxide dismutase, Fe-Mn family